MRTSAAIQHIRDIAMLGLPPKMGVAAMVDALDIAIPTRTKIFFWVDECNRARDFYERQPIMSALDAYFSQSAAMAADPDEPTFDKLANSPVDYGGWKRFERFPNWERSVLKNEVFGAYGIGNNLDFTIRESNRTIGVLALAREPGSSAYSRREIDTVLALRGHFVHAINAPTALDRAADRHYEHVVSAVVAFDGTVILANDAARAMLHQIREPQLHLRMDGRRAPDSVCRVIRLLAHANAGIAAPAPMLDIVNEWGRFRIVAHSMSSDQTCLITIEKFVARHLIWARYAATLDLSPRERTLAVELCSSKESRQIIRDAALSDASYREYTRRIYRRLNVDGRLGLRALFDTVA